MNDEIKEKIKAYYVGNDIDKIIDYITNLQQIEQDHKETNATLMSELAKLEEENERLKTIKPCMLNFQECYVVKDYKYRCEKASNKLSFIDEALENNTLNVPLCITKINSALNILQNGSDDNE